MRGGRLRFNPNWTDSGSNYKQCKDDILIVKYAFIASLLNAIQGTKKG